MSLKQPINIVLFMIVEIEISLNKPRKTANAFQNYFFIVVNLPCFKIDSILLNPNNNNAIKDKIGSLSLLKSVVPNNIPTKNLKSSKKSYIPYIQKGHKCNSATIIQNT